MRPSDTTSIVTASALNVRARASATAPVVGHLSKGESVQVLASDGAWLRVARAGLTGWCSSRFLLPVSSSPDLGLVTRLAEDSTAARLVWRDRGHAPLGYVKGMALSFARAYARWQASEPAALEIAKADTGVASRDALAHCVPQFAALGMSNEEAGVGTLRHLFVLLTGLGMRESSGRHCCGRDRSASNTSSDTAEAGLFQTSYDIRSASPLLVPMFRAYQARPSGFREVYEEGVKCGAADWADFGSGDGQAFQALTKACPDFAAQFAAVGLRNRRAHWGPVNRREVELRREVDDLLKAVQRVVDTNGLAPLLV